MKSIVIYATRTGNTRRIADAIAAELRPRGPVQLLSADEAPATFPNDTDLVVIGGPTEGHRMTEPIARFLDRVEAGALTGRATAAFDTRVRWPRWLSGSAANGITKRLRQAGARMIAPAESFFVNKQPLLEPGEVERAAVWARSLADTVEASAPVVPNKVS